MTNEKLRREVKRVTRKEIPTFADFEREVGSKIDKLPQDIRTIVEESIQDPKFKDHYVDFLDSYEKAATESKIGAPSELVSIDVISKAKENLNQKGIEIIYKSKPGQKEFKLKMESNFLTAIGALVSKLVTLF